MIKIRKPLGSEVSEKVKSWSQIKTEAWELKKFMDDKKFEGHWEDAYAISHTQVSEKPLAFFVLNKNMVKTFGSWCIVNLKIVKQAKPCTFPEGCMSFMYRGVKTVNRFADITVTYWTPFLNLFLIPHRRRFKAPLNTGDKGTVAPFICAHEADHMAGKNIYGI